MTYSPVRQRFLNGVCRHELIKGQYSLTHQFLNGVCRHEHEAMQAAAKELGVKLSYGGDWAKKDYPHWELA